MPDAAIGWHDVWRGGLLTAGLFTLGKTAIGYNLGQASVGSAYGAAGSLVVLLVWVYYSALILFFGAEFTQAWVTRHGGVAPQPHAIAGATPQTKSEAAPDRPRDRERFPGAARGGRTVRRGLHADASRSASRALSTREAWERQRRLTPGG